jgi:hypothetical protein
MDTNDTIGTPPGRQPMSGRRRAGAAAGLLLGGVLAGGLLAGTLSASADDASSSTPTVQLGTTATADQAPGDRDQSKSQRADEKLLTGDPASKVRAAALKKYPGATIERIETDSDGVYEAHLVTAAGDRVTVEVGKDFAITGEESGGHGGRGGRHDDDTTGSSSTGA